MAGSVSGLFKRTLISNHSRSRVMGTLNNISDPSRPDKLSRNQKLRKDRMTEQNK